MHKYGLDPMTLLFIYGTLKRGCSNHHELVGSFVGEARTVPGFTLHRLDGYPGMVASNNDAMGVHGELWLVGGAALAHLDAFEGVDEGLYFRGPIELDAPHGAEKAQTYFFAGSVEGREQVGSVWTEH